MERALPGWHPGDPGRGRGTVCRGGTCRELSGRRRARSETALSAALARTGIVWRWGPGAEGGADRGGETQQTKGKGMSHRTVTGAETPSRPGLIFGPLVA